MKPRKIILLNTLVHLFEYSIVMKIVCSKKYVHYTLI